jgi:S-DNA-T family DNA segregation ATPase FtsK/SpoIIIE
MRKKLEFQADRIEAVLSLHKISARVTGGTVTPRWTRFQVLPAMGAKISHIKNLHEELAQALDTPSCRVSRRGAAIAVEVPRDDPQPVRLLPLLRQLQQSPQLRSLITATLGLAEDGAPLLIRLPSPDVAHILVAGTTGAGKTVLLQTMILSLAMSNTPSDLSLMLIDHKGSAFTPFEGLPHLARPVIRDMEETTEALQSLVRLMERRGQGDKETRHPHVVIVIDELADLLMVGGKTVQWTLTRLTQRGREAAIHIIAATQKPTTAVLGSLVKANFPVRLVGRVMCTEDARVATGWSGSGAERLLGRGDFLAVAEGRVTRFQVAHVTAAEIRETVAKMPAATLPLTSPNTPAQIKPISPVFTLPALFHNLTKPLLHQANHALAQRLINSPLWSNRHATNDKTQYRWGWLSKACRLLFGQELEGTWHHQTRQVLALAEIISTTTTRKAPGEGPRGGIIESKG